MGGSNYLASVLSFYLLALRAGKNSVVSKANVRIII